MGRSSLESLARWYTLQLVAQSAEARQCLKDSKAGKEAGKSIRFERMLVDPTM